MFVIDSALRFPQCAKMITHDEIRAELLRKLDAKAFSAKSVAKLLGIPPPRITDIRIGKRRIQPREMAPLAEFLGMGKADQVEVDSSVIWVPVIGVASAGAWQEAALIPQYSIPMRRVSGRKMAFAVEVDGDSMDRLIPEGGWAAIDPDQRNLFDGKVYLISNGEFEATIKRYRDNPARFEPVSNNPEHKPFMVGDHLINVIGRVVAYGNDKGL